MPEFTDPKMAKVHLGRKVQTLPSGVEMIIAGNSDVPEATLVYVREVWDLLQQLSPRFMEEQTSPSA